MLTSKSNQMVYFQHSDKERIHELEEENKKLQQQSESYEKHFIQLVHLHVFFFTTNILIHILCVTFRSVTTFVLFCFLNTGYLDNNGMYVFVQYDLGLLLFYLFTLSCFSSFSATSSVVFLGFAFIFFSITLFSWLYCFITCVFQNADKEQLIHLEEENKRLKSTSSASSSVSILCSYQIRTWSLAKQFMWNNKK